MEDQIISPKYLIEVFHDDGRVVKYVGPQHQTVQEFDYKNILKNFNIKRNRHKILHDFCCQLCWWWGGDDNMNDYIKGISKIILYSNKDIVNINMKIFRNIFDNINIMKTFMKSKNKVFDYLEIFNYNAKLLHKKPKSILYINPRIDKDDGLVVIKDYFGNKIKLLYVDSYYSTYHGKIFSNIFLICHEDIDYVTLRLIINDGFETVYDGNNNV